MRLSIQQWIPMWVLPTVIVLSFVTVWLRLSVVKKTYELNQISRTVHNLKLENEQLDLQVAQLKSPRRLEALAQSVFQLHPPKSNQIIRMKELGSAPK